MINKSKRYHNYIYYNCGNKKPNFMAVCEMINIDNNFIQAFNEYQILKKTKFFKLIMFDKDIFYVTAILEIFNKFKIVI